MYQLSWRSSIRNWLYKLPFPISKNHQQELLAQKIIADYCRKDFNGIDIGSHEGDYLHYFLKHAPQGNHFGFEPLPKYFEYLKRRFKKNPRITLYNLAISDKKEATTFYHALQHPAYSGLKKRDYPTANEPLKEIELETNTLDNLFELETPIHLIKIDVEGGEFQVLKGGEKLIERHKPLILFEFGKGASDYYKTTPEEIFNFFKEKNYGIYSFEAYLKKQSCYDLKSFTQVYENRLVYYFVGKVKS